MMNFPSKLLIFTSKKAKIPRMRLPILQNCYPCMLTQLTQFAGPISSLMFSNIIGGIVNSI